MKTKIRLYLMTEKGYEVLKHFIASGKTEMIESVVSAKDDKVKDDYFERICDTCKIHNLHFYNRNELQDKTDNSIIRLAIGWRWLIESDFEHTKLLVIHDSLLPKYRGFAPVVSQLINGDTLLGATLIQANGSFDRGDIIFQETFEIDYPAKIERVIKEMTKIYTSIASKIIDFIENDRPFELNSQNEQLATYSVWRDAEDYLINWNSNSAKIMRFVNAVGFPYSGAKTHLNDREVIVEDVEIVKDIEIVDREAHIGKIIFVENGFPVVICQTGLLKIISGKYDPDGGSIIPVKKFRSRFK